jgi:predicted transcriptional regulator
MPSIRIRKESHEALARLADETGKSQAELVEQAVELLEDAIFYRRMRHAYSDPEAVRVAGHELGVWDATLSDGLEAI